MFALNDILRLTFCVTLSILLTPTVSSPIFGFNESSCSTMEPIYMGDTNPPPSTTKATPKEGANVTLDTEPEPEPVPTPELELVEEELFKITINDTMYRRNRVLEIEIAALSEGVTIEGYALQVRPSEEAAAERVGNFPVIKENEQNGFTCDGDDFGKNFLSTKQKFSSSMLPQKNYTSVLWMAPDDSSGELFVTAVIILKDQKYWKGKSSQTLSFNEFPPSRKPCGAQKSCVRIGPGKQNGCSPDECEYFLSWQLVDEDRNVDFLLGGKLDAGQFLGVAFINSTAMYSHNMHMLVCARLSESTGNVEGFFYPKKKKQPIESGLELSSESKNPDGNDRFWCTFQRAVAAAAPDGLKENVTSLDLMENFTLIYIKGKIKEYLNTNNESDYYPEIPHRITHGGHSRAWTTMEPMPLSQLVDIPFISGAYSYNYSPNSSILHIICFLLFTFCNSKFYLIP